MQFIRPRQVIAMIGVSRTTLWRMVRAGVFPRPVLLTVRNRAYVLEAVEKWMQARAIQAVPGHEVDAKEARRTILIREAAPLSARASCSRRGRARRRNDESPFP